MVRFQCQHCGARLQVSEAQAGKKGRCPHCKTPLVVPNPSVSAPAGEPPRPAAARAPATVTPYDLAFLETPKNESQAHTEGSSLPRDPILTAAGSYEAYGESAQEQAEHSGERKLPWPIDILLYPFNMAGLITLAIVIVIPLLINLAAGLVGPFGFFILIPGAVVDGVIGAYFLWYVGQCIADSAIGGVRAPETIAQAPGIWDMITQIVRLLACIAVSLLPMLIYWLSVQRVDAVFWSLLAFAAALCPMTLLAVTMFDSIGGLNPLILLGSVFSTFLPYVGLVLVLGSMIFLIANVRGVLADYPLLGYTFGITERYLVLVAAHLLGRFYWRYKEKLNWDV